MSKQLSDQKPPRKTECPLEDIRRRSLRCTKAQLNLTIQKVGPCTTRLESFTQTSLSSITGNGSVSTLRTEVSTQGHVITSLKAKVVKEKKLNAKLRLQLVESSFAHIEKDREMAKMKSELARLKSHKSYPVEPKAISVSKSTQTEFVEDAENNSEAMVADDETEAEFAEEYTEANYAEEETEANYAEEETGANFAEEYDNEQTEDYEDYNGDEYTEINFVEEYTETNYVEEYDTEPADEKTEAEFDYYAEEYNKANSAIDDTEAESVATIAEEATVAKDSRSYDPRTRGTNTKGTKTKAYKSKDVKKGEALWISL